MPSPISNFAYMSDNILEQKGFSEEIKEIEKYILYRLFDVECEFNQDSELYSDYQQTGAIPSYESLMQKFREFIINNPINFNIFQKNSAKDLILYISRMLTINSNDFIFSVGGDDEIIFYHENNLGKHYILIDTDNIYFVFYENNSDKYISKNNVEDFGSNFSEFLDFSFLYYAANTFKM